MSDGEISNWQSIKDEFIRAAKSQYYFHLQLGEKNQFCNDLKRAGLHVSYDSGKNAAKMVVDLTMPLITEQK